MEQQAERQIEHFGIVAHQVVQIDGLFARQAMIEELEGAGTGDRIDGAGIVGKARIDADGHVLNRAGAAVDPRPCAVPVPGRLRRGGQAEALEIGVGEALHGAAAVPAAGREMGLPEGVVVAQNGAVPAPVPGVCVWRLMNTVSGVILGAIIAVCRPVCKRTMVR